MLTEDIQKELKLLDEDAREHDNENACYRENCLMRRFIRHVSEVADHDLAIKAKLVLTSGAIDFER